MSEIASNELSLAQACAAGDSEAIRQLRADYLGEVVASVRRLRGAEQVGDLESQLLEHLLVAGSDGRPPRIGAYSGQGSLRGFLQSAATRLLLTELRKVRPATTASLEAQPSHATSPDLKAERDGKLDGVNDALKAAVTALTVRDRNLLRQHYVDGLTTAELAQLYGVHRATAVRWLADAREAVLQRTKDGAAAGLGVRPNEVESLFDLVKSQLDLSLSLFLSRS